MSKNVDEAISRKEEKCIMSFIPNMITIANFVCGLLAIYAVFVHDIYLGAVFIITGMLFDFLDGMVARKLDSVSEIGGELDSFADLVTFGVAPSILAYSASLKDLQSIGMICALAYSICGNVSPHFMFFKESSFRGVWYMRTRLFNGKQNQIPSF